MRNWNLAIFSLSLLVLGLVAMLYIWPTQYRYIKTGGLEARFNRFNGCSEVFSSLSGWYITDQRDECYPKEIREKRIQDAENQKKLKSDEESYYKENYSKNKLSIKIYLSGQASYNEILEKITLKLFNRSQCPVEPHKLTLKYDEIEREYNIENLFSPKTIYPGEVKNYSVEVLGNQTLVSGKWNWYISDFDYGVEKDISCLKNLK